MTRHKFKAKQGDRKAKGRKRPGIRDSKMRTLCDMKWKGGFYFSEAVLRKR